MHVQRVLEEGLLYPEQVYSSELKCHGNKDDLYHGNQAFTMATMRPKGYTIA